MLVKDKRKQNGWDIVQLARHPNRPRFHDYVEYLFTDFYELHGDRYYGDDEAIIGGFARFSGNKVMILGHEKGHDGKDSIKRNFGCAMPEGYRKSLRLMKLAEKFKLPVLCFIDTPGALPTDESEERGIAVAIARNLYEMSRLKTQIIKIK